jgi:predicted DNA-binding transcriptional regulator YafY
MRSSRLLSLLLLLQARGQMTARELAEELDVSERTLYRDIAALGAAGVPVYGERGEGGGYRLLDGFRTNLTGLTQDEAAGLLLAGAGGAASQLGLGAILASVRLRLLAAVPAGLREVAVRAEQRFYLDAAGWAHARNNGPRSLELLAREVWEDRRVAITHARGDGRVVHRTLDPLGLVHKTGAWYLVGRSEGRIRVYRVDRIRDVQTTMTAAYRPVDFDLAKFWAGWEADYAAGLPTFTATVRLGPLAQRYRDSLGPLSPRSVTIVEEGPDGWTVEALVFDTQRSAVAALLALSPDVEVLAPLELGADLAEVALAVAQRHRPTVDPRSHRGTT